jgi:hypothetical protein
MRTLAIVVADPIRNLRAGLIEAEEQGFVEQLVAHPAIEAFTEAVLRRFSRRNEMLGDLIVLRPGQHGVNSVPLSETIMAGLPRRFAPIII